jgi:secreted trypsin-like serine protease
MRRLIFALAALLVLLPLATLPARAVTDGTPDGNDHPFVGLITDGVDLCSGALVAPDVVLTAGHCTSAFAAKDAEIAVTFDPEPTADSTFIPGTPYTAPGYAPDGVPGLPGAAAQDVGVVVLDEPVSLSSYGALPENNVDDALDVADQPLTIVGYGVQEITRGGRRTGYGSRAAATLAPLTDLVALDDQYLALVASTGDDAGACFGDSGGPVLLGSRTVVGVVAAGEEGCGGLSLASRLDTPEVIAFLGRFLDAVPSAEADAPAADTDAPTNDIRVGGTVVVTESGVRLREAPSTDAGIVTELSAGQALTVTGPAETGSGYRWWPVRDPAAPELAGYVAAEFLQPATAASE